MESIPAKMMPVPRKVSSSCGTGVRFETEQDASGFAEEGLDRIFSQRDSLYDLVFENRPTA